jgi:hypothetical protein
MSLHSYHYTQAARIWGSPPDEDEPRLTLPDFGTCPCCRKPLHWDGVNEALAWCETPRCEYDNGISEEENREIWRLRNE